MAPRHQISLLHCGQFSPIDQLRFRGSTYLPQPSYRRVYKGAAVVIRSTLLFPGRFNSSLSVYPRASTTCSSNRDAISSLMPSIPRSMFICLIRFTNRDWDYAATLLFQSLASQRLPHANHPHISQPHFHITLLALLYHMHVATARQISGRRSGWRLQS